MSELPQQRKSPEEIARLRRHMGVLPEESTDAAASPTEPSRPQYQQPVATLDPTSDTVMEPSLGVLPVPPMQSPVAHGPKPVHSLKKSEQIPGASFHVEMPVPEQPAIHLDPEVPAQRAPKQVHSLKKSEQGPVYAQPLTDTPASSKLPHHRHTDEELQRLRRQQTIESNLHQPAADKRFKHIHSAIPAVAYIVALAGLAWIKWPFEFPLAACLACETVAIAVGILALVKYPLSRHHGAFLIVIPSIILIFSILHYFPHLKYGT